MELHVDVNALTYQDLMDVEDIVPDFVDAISGKVPMKTKHSVAMLWLVLRKDDPSITFEQAAQTALTAEIKVEAADPKDKSEHVS